MPSRLSTLDTALSERIESLDSTRQRRLAVDVATKTAEFLGVAGLPAVNAALGELSRGGSLNDTSALAALVEHMDEVAWDFDDAGRQDEYLAAFSQARACNSVLAAASDDAEDAALNACYESHAATGSLDIATKSLVLG